MRMPRFAAFLVVACLACASAVSTAVRSATERIVDWIDTLIFATDVRQMRVLFALPRLTTGEQDIGGISPHLMHSQRHEARSSRLGALRHR